MKRFAVFLAAAAFPAVAFAAAAAGGPDWAFPNQDNSPQPPQAAAPAAGGGGGAGNRMGPDAAAPAIVNNGRDGGVRACNGCHFVTGLGEPESAGLAALPAGYFVQTMADFRSGVRKGSRAGNMITFAKALTDDENKVIADYYAKLQDRTWTHVVEATDVPKTYIANANARRVWPDGGNEPIGERIIEYAQDFDNLRAANSPGYTAFVPMGSLARGEMLVKGGGGVTPCATCHGANWTGNGDIPGLAGRSPVYTARQIYMYQSGDRAGPNGEIMKGVVGKLNDRDIISIAAYLGSRPPA